jgi:hypothetical protein
MKRPRAVEDFPCSTLAVKTMWRAFKMFLQSDFSKGVRIIKVKIWG